MNQKTNKKINLESKIINKIRSLDLDNANIWINEALFGYEHIKEYCKKLKGKSKVLEIGCGSGILLSLLEENFNNLLFEGLEPFGDGFSSLKIFNTITKNSGIKIRNTGYENFKPSSKYDLIFCINVFEHLKDWKNFLIRVQLFLTKNGRLIILCPNYGFPYESHFKIPIIVNKKITYYFFKEYIQKYEEKNNFKGLWKSLNLIKKKELKNFLKKNKYNNNLTLYNDYLSIIDFMIERIFKDREFRKRQKFVGFIAFILFKFGAIKILKYFPDYIPYMKLEFKLKLSKNNKS